MREEIYCRCSNSKCSRKDTCLRFALKKDLINGEACLELEEEHCREVNFYIEK